MGSPITPGLPILYKLTKENKMTNEEEIIHTNCSIIKEYLIRNFPKTWETLYRDFRINYNEHINDKYLNDIFTISFMVKKFLNRTLLEDCELTEQE